MSVYLDSNVFLYAAGTPHPLKEPCLAVLRRVEAGELDATTSTEALQEILHVFQRRSMAAQGASLVKTVLSLLPEVLPVDRYDVSLAADLAPAHPTLPARDPIHAAVMRHHGIREIISADKHFDALSGVRRLVPEEVA